VAWLFARSTDRRFLLRIEDLDFSRVRPGLAEQQRADLTALGVEFDEPIMVQSQRMASYEQALARLAERSYECFCTRREIAEAASAPHGPVGRYPGTCRDLTEVERATRRAMRSPALRLRAAGDETPTYAHVPLAVNSAGQRLAKRDGPVTLSDLAKQGVSPAHVLQIIACTLDLMSPGERASLADLLERFEPQRIPRQPWVIGQDLLSYFQ